MKTRTVPPQMDWVLQFTPSRVGIRRLGYERIKRVFDMLAVLTSAPAWLPIMGLCALALKLSAPRAPVFYRQARTGREGRRFQIYKFRSMVVDADKMKDQLQHMNELRWPDFKISRDPRVSRVGRVLRRASLDELPQLINVLKGEMSLVGPRPTSFASDTYEMWHTERLEVPPGITGLWQLYYRGATEFDTRLRIDIAYIQRRGFWLDVQLLFRTVFSIFNGSQAVH